MTYHGNIPIEKSDIYPYKKGFTIHSPMKFNPDSIGQKEPFYYYFDLSYSDLSLEENYHFDIAMKIPPFRKGKYLNKLALCKDWEKAKVKKMVEESSKIPMIDINSKN